MQLDMSCVGVLNGLPEVPEATLVAQADFAVARASRVAVGLGIGVGVFIGGAPINEFPFNEKATKNARLINTTTTFHITTTF